MPWQRLFFEPALLQVFCEVERFDFQFRGQNLRNSAARLGEKQVGLETFHCVASSRVALYLFSVGHPFGSTKCPAFSLRSEQQTL